MIEIDGWKSAAIGVGRFATAKKTGRLTAAKNNGHFATDDVKPATARTRWR
jgi:hypothetical protein